MRVNGPVDVAARPRARERVVVHVDSLAARWIGALALLSAAGWLILILARHHQQPYWHYADRLGWSLTVLGAVALIARGIFLGRPVTAMHATTAALFVLAGLGAHVLSFDLLGNLLIVSSGMVLMWPTSARPRSEDLPRVWALIDVTGDDPLAPFAMQTRQVLPLHRGRAPPRWPIGRESAFAVVSGDPIGREDKFPELVADFAAMCHARGWRIAVVGCSERRLRVVERPRGDRTIAAADTDRPRCRGRCVRL